MKKLLIALCASVLFLGLTQAQSSQDMIRTISVSGTAKIAVDIDYIQLGFAVVTRDKSFEKAQTDNLKIVASVIQELGAKQGIAKADIYTDDYTLQEYYPEQYSGIRKRDGYESRTAIRVNLRETTKYKDILIAILRLGVNNIDSVTPIPKELGPYKLKALRLAFEMARKKADEIASAAGCVIKRLLFASESSYSPSYNTQSFAQSNMSVGGGNLGESGEAYSLGQYFITVEVSAGFEIQ